MRNDILENSDDEMIGLYDVESHRREIGRTSREEAIEQGIMLTAKNMLKENIDINTISKVTGLSIEKIKKLC